MNKPVQGVEVFAGVCVLVCDAHDITVDDADALAAGGGNNGRAHGGVSGGRKAGSPDMGLVVIDAVILIAVLQTEVRREVCGEVCGELTQRRRAASSAAGRRGIGKER